MRIVIAPDSFKESATARQVAEAIASGVRRAVADAELVLTPMADGGEGTVDALVAATAGRRVDIEVTGPLGEPVQATYGLLGNGDTAIIEMAAASGLALVPVSKRDPRITTTRGTGELIRDALDRHVRRIIVGLGGSATNDAGAGMAQALGFRLLDTEGRDLPPGGAALADLRQIDASGKHPRLEATEFLVACDVANPLCGPGGASLVYGPQKGASPEAAQELDKALRHFANVVNEQLGVNVLNLPGAGAAGGLGGGLVAFAAGRLRSGFELIAEACHLENHLRDADLVITGEGRLDRQTAHGKTPLGVAEMAKRYGVPVVALAGALGNGWRALYPLGIDAMFAIADKPMEPAEAFSRTLELVSATAEAVIRTWLAGSRSRA